MSELIILLGMGEAGKTTYAESIKTHTKLDFDSFRPYGDEESFNRALSKIASTINEKPNEDFVLDGYVYPYKNKILGINFTLLKQLLKYHTITPVVVHTKVQTIVDRVVRRGSPDNVDEKFVKNLYRQISDNFVLAKCIEIKGGDFVECDKCFAYKILL